MCRYKRERTMLKMIIVDDEKIIRETIHSIIDWSSLGIEVVAVCKDGIEAFDSIVDEYPDIVMTDIKMPGLSGLELIRKVQEAELSMEFIILSGYGEFEFAQTAMKYGVKHYLLKPSDEMEIVQVMQSCIATCREKIAARVDSLTEEMLTLGDKAGKLFQQFYDQMSNQQDLSLAKTQVIKLLAEAAKRESIAVNYSKVQLTEDIMAVNGCEDMRSLLKCVEEVMTRVFSAEPQHKYIDCVEKVIEYVEAHLNDSNLSLKWIAENYLFMSADYVSKQFVRQTGSKFSTYVTELRIQEAKKLLLEAHLDSPYAVAEKVGFGNNPQYFSQIFKKYTKMSPTAYIKMMTEG